MNSEWLQVFLHFLPEFVQIIVLAFAYYYVLRALSGTRGMVILVGSAAVLLLPYIVARLTGLNVIKSIIENMFQSLPVFLVVIFQVEIRRLLSQITSGRTHRTVRSDGDHPVNPIVPMLVPMLGRLSSSRTGALIAIEQSVGLDAICQTGTMLHAPFMENALLETIFYEGTPLHDGGVVIRDMEIAAAGCIFPLAERENCVHLRGMRHQAALGLSEQCDAFIVVVSEETGFISVATNGHLERMKNLEQLQQLMGARLMVKEENEGIFRSVFRQIRAAFLWKSRKRRQIVVAPPKQDASSQKADAFARTVIMEDVRSANTVTSMSLPPADSFTPTVIMKDVPSLEDKHKKDKKVEKIPISVKKSPHPAPPPPKKHDDTDVKEEDNKHD